MCNARLGYHKIVIGLIGIWLDFVLDLEVLSKICSS